MVEAESAFQLLGLGGMALVAVRGEDRANFLFEERDLLGFESLPTCDQGAAEAQDRQ
jgi:hypothetical protein